MNVAFELNGEKVVWRTAPNRTLLDLLRVDMGLTSVKKGCEQGECGVCTVLLNGAPVNSCLLLGPQINGKSITTMEGLSDDPLMKELCGAFLENGAIQCGFCTPGMLLSAYALLKKNTRPTIEEIKKSIEGNLCRCTGYVKIVGAILDAVRRNRIE